MPVQSEELLEKIRKQFDFGPYPRIPLDATPQGDLQNLFNHNLITPYYMRCQKLPSPTDFSVLDVGCGSGYKTLQLAYANPGARIIGVDISEKSIELAKERFAFHKVKNNADFQVLDIADLGQLDETFDYINCDEILYLLPDPPEALRVMRSVLKKKGIIRSNLHSALQRVGCFRAQAMFQMMGLMDGNPEELEIELALEIMKSLKPQVDLKRRIFPNEQELDGEYIEEEILMNLLLQGDKGYTISDLSQYLQQANLELVSMVNPRQWEILDLFKDPSAIPAFLSMGLENASAEEKLRLYELIQPRHRLLDFWCGHQSSHDESPQGSEQSERDWSNVTVHLHPQLLGQEVRDHVVEAIRQGRGCSLSQFLPLTTLKRQEISSSLAASLLPLWDGPSSFPNLVEHWLRVHPLDLVTAEEISPEYARGQLRDFLSTLEVFLYVLIERE